MTMSYRIVLAVTGGGSRIIPQLLARSGASQTVLEASVPYHPAALEQYIGGRVERACSEATARRLAVAAYQRARRWAAHESQASPSPANADQRRQELAGVACTAALATNRVRRGRDRAYVAVHTWDRTRTWAADFGHNESDREAQETKTASLIAAALRDLEIPVDAGRDAAVWKVPGDLLQKEKVAPACWADLAAGKISAVGASDGRVWANPPVARSLVLFSGSFDPLHEGHRQMARIAAEHCDRAVTFELSITNADKPPLDFLTISERVEQFTGSSLPLLLTRSPRFDQKAELFPNSVFVIGADTAVRLGDPRFYGNDSAQRDRALQRIAAAGGRFLVFGRQLEHGFADPQSLPLPAGIRELCECVPEMRFRNDISSTELRARAERE